MIVHIRDYGVEPELDAFDAFTHDDERSGTTRPAPIRRSLSPRILRAVNPMLDADDDFDVSKFVGRGYQ